MIQGGDYLLKENEELGGENDHKMIILLTFYPVKVGSRVYVVCFKSTGYYIKGKPSIAGTMLGRFRQVCINALLWDYINGDSDSANYSGSICKKLHQCFTLSSWCIL